jgi:hypothetical protein
MALQPLAQWVQPRIGAPSHRCARRHRRTSPAHDRKIQLGDLIVSAPSLPGSIVVAWTSSSRCARAIKLGSFSPLATLSPLGSARTWQSLHELLRRSDGYIGIIVDVVPHPAQQHGNRRVDRKLSDRLR